MKTIIDTMPMTITAEFMEDYGYRRMGKRNLKQRVRWYQKPRGSGILLPRVLLEAYLLDLGFECVRDKESDE